MDILRIYTDGSCVRNPGGAGGWAVVVVREDQVVETFSGGLASTTSNRAELLGVINAVERLTIGQFAEVFCDSKYVVDPVRSGSVWGYECRGWRHRNGKPVANHDLWSRLVCELRTRTEVSLSWIRGHCGNRYNELADSLAKRAARGPLVADSGYPCLPIVAQHSLFPSCQAKPPKRHSDDD